MRLVEESRTPLLALELALAAEVASVAAYARNRAPKFAGCGPIGDRPATAQDDFLKVSDLSTARGTIWIGEMVPEEHSYRARKRLIFHANPQRKIAGTINSTNTSSGKGWMSLDKPYLAELAAA